MPIGNDPARGLYFTGKVAPWAGDIKNWYETDKRTQEYMDFGRYTFILATSYGDLAEKAWSHDRGKLERLRPLLHKDDRGHHQMSPYQALELLDFLAETLPDDFRKANKGYCLERVKAYINDHYEGKNYSLKNGRLEVRGRLGDCIKDLSAWYQADSGKPFSTLTDLQQQAYMIFVAMGYGQAAYNQWAHEPGGDKKIEGFQALLATDASGNLDFFSVNAFALLDYLVENLTDDFRRKHEHEARSSARQYSPRDA